jgi:hypothetical protein
LAVVGVLAAGAAVLWRLILVKLGSVLTVEDTFGPADFIFILTGNVNRCRYYAAELYNAGPAPRVLIPKAWG